MSEVSDSDDLLQRYEAGDVQVLSTLFAQHRSRLKRMVELRLDRRIWGRVDPSDVIQDAYLQATKRAPKYFRERPMPFFLWLRFLVSQRLMELHRFHLGAQRRDANREISLNYAPFPKANSAMLAAQLVGSLTAPSQAAVRAEQRISIQQALDSLEPIDREIIALRHFEQLSRSEAVEVLGIEKAAAAKRYLRAMDRLRTILEDDTAMRKSP